MRIRIITLITLVAFFIMSTGCVSIKYIPISEITESEVVLVGVTLLNGDEIIFDKGFGQYDKKVKIVSGVTPEGESVVFKLNELRSVHYYKPEYGSELIMTVSAPDFYQLMKDNKEIENIDGVILRSDKTIRFLPHSGRIDKDFRVITGLSTTNSEIKIPFEDIKYVRVKKDNTSGLLVAGCCIGGGLIILAILVAESTADTFGEKLGELFDWD